MAMTRTKRPLTARTNDVDCLASKLGSRLKISDVPNNGSRARKGTSLAQATKSTCSPEESKVAAMKSINNVLQSLASSAGGKGSSMRSTVSASATAGRAALNILRKLNPELVDTERAALSMVGKLLASNMHDVAASILGDIRNHLPTMFDHKEVSVSRQTPLSLIQLPLPDSSLDPSIQTCIQTYLSHAFSIVTQAVSITPDRFESFCDILDGPTSLRSWVPFLTALSRKSLDSLFKRTYVSLTTSFTSPPTLPSHVLKIRFHALRILLLSSDLDVTPFWEQCLKYAASYARTEERKGEEGKKITALLTSFASIVPAADGRREGKGWLAFCEYWLALAQRARDMETLGFVAEYISHAASSSDDTHQPITRARTALTQLVVTLDQSGEINGQQLSSRTDTASSELRDVQTLLSIRATLDGKLLRAVEKCRKGCLKALSYFEPGTSERSSIIQMLDGIVAFLEYIICITAGSVAERTDAIVSSLDALFQLATAVLDAKRAETCDHAYDYLMRGLHLIERCPSDAPGDKRATANYMRCLSGAFANLAGSLFKAERHGIAIRFLVQACPLSTRASEYISEADSRETAAESEKDRGVWSTHRVQTYRRWELLGVCYVKTGDRRLAHDAFVQGVVTYPFEDEKRSGDLEVMASLANAIDRLTYLAVVDLRLDPAEISLVEPLRARCVPPSVLGSILLRQASSLSDRSKLLVRAAVSGLLADALNVYDGARFPMRRTRVLVLLLEHNYFGADKDAILDRFRVPYIIQETEALLSEKANAGEDGMFAHLRRYYRATIMLWAVLHAHRAGESMEYFIRNSQHALDALGVLTVEPASMTGVNEKTVGRSRKMTTSSTARSKSCTVPRGRAPSMKDQITKSNSARRSPRTPNDINDTNAKTCTIPSQSENRELSVSDRTSLVELILMVMELLDLSGLILVKLRFLGFVRRILENAGEITSDTFLRSSSMLAHDLLKLGKLTLASRILAPIANAVCESTAPSPAAVHLLLGYAELLALSGEIVESLSTYEKAFNLSDDLPGEENGRGVSIRSSVRARAVSLERIATASIVFAVIQDAKNELANSLKARLQALRLLNRATETLARLNPLQNSDSSPDPFSMSDIKDVLPAGSNTTKLDDDKPTAARDSRPRLHLDGLELRIANALLHTQLALAQSYTLRGSMRESEYFEHQAEELARALGAPAMVARALVQKSELQLSVGNSDEAQKHLEEAMDLTQSQRDLDKVDVHRAIGDRLVSFSSETDAESEFSQAITLLVEAKQSCDAVSKLVLEPPSSDPECDFAPVLKAKILRQQVWLLRDALGARYEQLLEELYALPQLPYIEVHVNPFLGRLALYDIHERFRADMSLNSLAESTIALPMGMTCEKSLLQAPPKDIVDALQQADEHYVSDLSRFSGRGSVIDVRATAVAAARVSTYQASLGIAFEDSPAFASRLLDMASSITLRRELVDAISFKYPNPMNQDDTRWPSESPSTVQRRCTKPKGRGIFDDLMDYDDDDSVDDNRLRQYWDFTMKKYKSEAFIQPENSSSDIDSLPDSWMVITISLTEDKGALLVSRQRRQHGPMTFCVPLKGRREDEEEGHFSFEDAMTELKDIIKLNDEGARGASQIKADDKEAKVAWWASRKQLDQRLKNFVENVEFCWLGAFKTILSQPMCIPHDAISGLQARFEKVFRGILGSHEKKSKKAKLRLETNLLELFAALPPTCRDEELQDLVYFVLDLYHFHGLPVALAEIDIDVVVVDLRSALEEFHSRIRGRIAPEGDAHTFLVLDKNMQAIPWESLPILRGRSVSRVPGIAFITDRLAFVKCQRRLPLDPKDGSGEEGERIDRVPVNPSKGYYVLNPSGDLSGTEGRFKSWANDLRKAGWDGIIGHTPSEQQFLNALTRKDLVVYFGHGGAEQYARSHKIRHLQRCAATMLWGCSSGALHDMGEFDRIGTPNNYMLAGCPSLVANLWDVTDRDIDKFAQSVFNKLRLEPSEVGEWRKGKRGLRDGKVSVVTAVAQSRDVCKLKYLTGAAVVVYGIPYYL